MHIAIKQCQETPFQENSLLSTLTLNIPYATLFIFLSSMILFSSVYYFKLIVDAHGIVRNKT